ncbi:hypothetical protein R3W88_026625 [Solanum pinnatisectum]|uniref:Uncharacterized protein n=1 Tax=Solanum pinnatisectum TaxID=50273 RepID=A0AAV9LDT4_9SOLN|nr:hypothetical protein R3W88_026625 [Solanum pinnatisectum]
MEEQSPSKRITRGIHLHATNLVGNSSFSLDLTQFFEAIAGSIVKYEDIDSSNMTKKEIRSMFLNDPLILIKISKERKRREKKELIIMI